MGYAALRREPDVAIPLPMKKIPWLAGLLAAAALLWFCLRPPANDPVPVPAKNVVPAHGAQAVVSNMLTRLSPEASSMWEWASDYAAAGAGERAAMLESGKALAAAHRARMKSLISVDPRRALEEALPVVLRQELPAEILESIEQRVNARGFYGVLGVAGTFSPPADSVKSRGLEVPATAVRRSFQTNGGAEYVAIVYGRRVRQRTTENAAVHGVAVDGMLAMHEDPLRALEQGERLRADQRIFFNCPVSGKVTAAQAEITPDMPAVEAGGEVHVLCSGGHIHALREELIAAEGGSGGPSKPTGAVPSSWTSGVKSVLYIRVTFPEQWTDPQQEKDAYDMMKSVNDFFVENSHGALHLMTTVTPLLTMPKPEAWYKANDGSSAYTVLNDARATARAAGFDYAAYDLDAVRYSGASGGFSGQAYVGGRGCWLKSSSAGVAAHEFGHNLGLWHANYWSTGGESAIGSGSNSEYGNSFDTMGSANAGNYSFNAGHQNDLRWIPNANVTRVTGSGLYRIQQFDQGRLDPAARYLLMIKKDAQRDYWCEFRQKWTTNRWLTAGVPLLWSPWGDGATDNTAYGSNGGGQLLDTTPGSPDGKEDSAIVIGRTFSDRGAEVHITPLAKSGTVPESVDVVVNVGSFPGNQPPSLELNANTLTAATNETVTFTATALDPDNDALAYSWDWGDRTFGTNTAIATKAWSTAGLYTVRCEVSDMRGGVRSTLLAVTVGSPAQWRIGGRVLTAAGDPIAGARVSSVTTGGTGTNPRACLSDSEGNYLLSGLPAESYTLSAAHPSQFLAAALTNPLILTDADIAADYTATAKSTVTMTLPDDSCTENGDGAVLRFTRSAATNAGAINVRVFAGGSANMSDVNFAPAETYDLTTYKFTIPDGQQLLDVAVTAFNDSSAEGPELLNFYLIDASGYVPAGVEHVTLAVNDDDTTLPVVSLEAIDTTATEGSDGATLRLTRTGPVEAALVVSLTRSGTATTPADYTGINATATVRAGEVFADLALTTVQDSAAEGSETATFSLTSSATWIRSPQKNTASVVILDDDIPVLTITAADGAASESNSDPAVFIITRTGDLTAALSVDYATGGTAQHGTDYQPLSGTVTIPAGLANAALVIMPVDDSIGEVSQTISVQLRSAARYLVGAAFSASATLTDNDLPHLMATVSDGSCDESGGTGKFKIQSYASGSGNTTVFYTINGTATSGVDFTAASGTATVPKNGFTEVTITPLQDAEMEDAESVSLTLLPDAAYSLSPEDHATLMIVDDDQPLVSVAAAATSYSENGGTARFFFTRNGATPDPLTVSYSLTGTATPGTDYTAPPGTIVIPVAAAGAALDVPLLDDADAEGAESLICTVVSTPGVHGARIATATTWVNDNDSASLPAVTFEAAASTFDESAGTVSIPVTLSPAAVGEVRVDYALDSGLAFNGVDYLAAGGTLIFAPGETTQNIAINVLDDIFHESAESLTLRLVHTSAARLGFITGHTLTITDNDSLPPPVIGFSSIASGAGEGSGTPPQALVFLSAPQAASLSVQWAVTGGSATAADAAALSGTLTFQPGETAKGVPLTLLDDTLLEPAETFIITLSDPLAPASLAPLVTHTLTVSDNDDTTISLAATDASAGEAGSDPGVITATRVSANLWQAVTVLLTSGGSASAGDDYQSLPAELVIPANQASASISIVPMDDVEFDPAETVILSLAPSPYYAMGSPASAAITITDNETGISVAATDALAAEPAESGNFTLTRIGLAAGEITVPLTTGGTATPGEDFVPLPASVVFADGQTSAVVNVMPLDDFTAEPDETVTLAVVPGAGYFVAMPPAQVTLRDDDTNLAPVVTIQSPASGSAFIPSGPGLLLDTTVTDDGRPFSTAPLSFNWSMISGPGSVRFGDPGIPDTTAQFSAPGQYLLRLTAADAELTTTANLSVFVLSDTLTGVNVGTTSTATGLAGGGEGWTLTGAGSGVTSTTTDGFFFAHRQMSGDFTVIARVNSIAPAGASTSSRCGVMVRSALTPGARHAFMAARPASTSFVWRTTDGSNGTTATTSLSPALPRFVRLRRTGNAFTAAHSVDGNTWTTQGSAQTITMPDPVHIGLAATSASTTASTTVVAAFDSFALTRIGNTGPFVDAGPPQSGGPNATLAGLVTDDSGPPAVLWEKLGGPDMVTLPSTPDGNALFAVPGLYTLRLSAGDGTVRTFDDTSVTVASPFSAWQALHFGAGADPPVAGPRADPDNDGLENLAEYVLTSNPLNSDAAAAPTSSRTATTLSMMWRESGTATDVLIQPQWSDDLAAWDSAALTIETVSAGPGWLEKCATLDITSRAHAALRLLVTMP